MEVTRTLARFIVGHRYHDIPEKVRHEAARSFLNWVGCAVGAARHETVERALAALNEFSGPREATVLGRGDRLDIMLAALMNGQTLMWALIWAAHIGFDRALGYGLKYPTSFGETHLGRIGRRH